MKPQSTSPIYSHATSGLRCAGMSLCADVATALQVNTFPAVLRMESTWKHNLDTEAGS